MIFRSSGLRCILLLFVIICLYALVATAHGTLKQWPNPVTGDDDTTQTDHKLTDDDYGNSCMCFFIYVLSNPKASAKLNPKSYFEQELIEPALIKPVKPISKSCIIISPTHIV